MHALRVAVLSFIAFIATCSHCFALMSIAQVSTERAKELGIELRLKGNGPEEFWVELEFPLEGKLKNFSHVSLEIGEGEELLVGYAPLRERRSNSGSVVVGFMANRVYLDKVTLRICVGPPTNLTGFDLRVKEFVDPQMAR